MASDLLENATEKFLVVNYNVEKGKSSNWYTDLET